MGGEEEGETTAVASGTAGASTTRNSDAVGRGAGRKKRWRARGVGATPPEPADAAATGALDDGSRRRRWWSAAGRWRAHSGIIDSSRVVVLSSSVRHIFKIRKMGKPAADGKIDHLTVTNEINGHQ